MGQSCTLQFGNPPVADGGVWRSDDHGQSWQQKVFVSRTAKKTETIGRVSILAFAFDPKNSQRIFLGTRGNGVWKTDNRGEQWKPTSLRTGNYRCVTFDPDNGDIVYTASGTTVLKSQDSGDTWQTVYNESQPGHIVTCVLADPVLGNYVWAVTSGGKVLLSEDFGQTWTLKQTLPAFEARRLYVPPDAPSELYVFTQKHGIFHLTGYGATQEDLTPALQQFPGATDIRAVTIPDGPTGAWYLGTQYGLLVSSDRGQNWNAIPTLVTPGSIAIANVAVNTSDPSEIFLTVGQKLHHTLDGGQSWEVTNLPTTQIITLLTIDPEDITRLYYSTLIPEKS